MPAGDFWNFTIGGGGINPNSIVQANEQSNTDLNINSQQNFNKGNMLKLPMQLPINENNPIKYINGVPIYSINSDVSRSEGFQPDVTLGMRVCTLSIRTHIWRTPNNFYINNGPSCPAGNVPSNWERIESYEFDQIRILRTPNTTPILDLNSGAVDPLRDSSLLLEDLKETTPTSIFNNVIPNPVIMDNKPVSNNLGSSIPNLDKSTTLQFLGEKIILPLIIGIGTLYFFQKYTK